VISFALAALNYELRVGYKFCSVVNAKEVGLD